MNNVNDSEINKFSDNWFINMRNMSKASWTPTWTVSDLNKTSFFWDNEAVILT